MNTQKALDDLLKENHDLDVAKIIERNTKVTEKDLVLLYENDTDNKHGVVVTKDESSLIGPGTKTAIVLDGDDNTVSVYGGEFNINTGSLFWRGQQFNEMLHYPIIGWGVQYLPVYTTSPSVPHTHAVVTSGVTGPDTPHTHTIIPKPLRILTTEAEVLALLVANMAEKFALLSI